MICIHTSKECKFRHNYIHCMYERCVKDEPINYNGDDQFVKDLMGMFFPNKKGDENNGN